MSDSSPSVVELWITLNNTVVLALSIPLEKCQTFSVHPLKWLRFLGYSIYGRKGYLSMSETGPPLIDDAADILACPYYFIPEGTEEPLFADACVISDRTSFASCLSRIADFRGRIIERDGTCVCSDQPFGQSTACHIIPHSKGDEYIQNLLSLHGNIIELSGIDDLKNGLLLWDPIHTNFGVGSMAFLKTPNLYLTCDDIPRVVRSNSEEDQTIPTNRITVHYLADPSELGTALPSIVPNNSDLREPADTSEWPPAVIINSFYISAVLQEWAPDPFIQILRTSAIKTYYNFNGSADEPKAGVEAGVETNPQAGFSDLPAPISSRAERLLARNLKKMQSEGTSLSELMDGVLAFRMRSSQSNKVNTDWDLSRQDRVTKWVHDLDTISGS